MSALIAGHGHHVFLPGREVMTGTGTVPVQVPCRASKTGDRTLKKAGGCSAALAVSEGHYAVGLSCSTDHAAKGTPGGRPYEPCCKRAI